MQSLSQQQSALEQELFAKELGGLRRLTDRIFLFLLLGQWLFAVICAVFITPRTWQGAELSPHIHLLAALGLGGILVSLPCALIVTRPGAMLTRFVVAASQLLFSVLLTHLTGGRIETHFHIFVSLAILAFYHDIWVYVPAVAVSLLDHIVRGLFWPESIFGTVTPSVFRAFEHIGWIAFATFFLVWGVRRKLTNVRKMAQFQASLSIERDNLERRVSERTQLLGEARDYFVNVLDSLDDHIAILDSEGVIKSVNKAWRMFGEANDARTELCGPGANYLDVCRRAGESALAITSAMERILAGEAGQFTTEYSCNSRTEERWFQLRVLPFVGTSGTGLVVAHANISERVAAREAFMDKARTATSLAEIIRDAPNEFFLCRQSDLQIVMVNYGLRDSLGYSEDELCAMTALDLLPQAERCKPNIYTDKFGGKYAHQKIHQLNHQRSSGEVYPVQLSVCSGVYEGEPIFAVFATDVSTLQKLQGQLAQALKLESLAHLAAGIAHEINTPMQSVASNVEFLQSCLDRVFRVLGAFQSSLQMLDEQWKAQRESLMQLTQEAKLEHILLEAPRAVTEAAEACKRVIEIVRAMKCMSHPGGKDKIKIDLNEIIRNATTISRNHWKHSATLHLHLDEDLPEVDGHIAELSQVILNLIVNAADAVAEKHGSQCMLGQIDVRTSATADFVRVEVEDNGCGMSPEVFEKAFDPFFTTKPVGKGTGQGLAITHNAIVNMHGGTIDILSTPGAGTTFMFCLPRADYLHLETQQALAFDPVEAL